jgi:hypothetical protein
MTEPLSRVGLIALYLGAIVAANLLVAAFGPAISIVNAFLFIGLDLTTRDALDERWDGRRAPMLGLIAVGGALSYLLNRDAGIIAVASTVAFTVAAIADWTVYHLLGAHPRWLRVNGSNIVGAAVDSILFPTIAFGGFLPLVTLGQFAAKVLGGAFWFMVLRAVPVRRRAA